MLAREDPLLQRTGAIPEVYFNLRAPRERARPRARALARLYSLPANLRRAANERFTFNVISVRGA